MGNIFTRKALSDIMANEGLTPEQRTEQVMSLYGRALDDGYISRSAAQTAQETAITNAKAEWEKNLPKPDVKASDEYKALETEYAGYKAMQTARTSDEYKGVKGKFFETVYGMVDKKDGAKPVSEQIAEIRKNYEEYFEAANEPKNTPQFSQQPGRTGTNPTSEEDKLFKQLSDSWK
jgi:hypothetical protein